MTEQGMREAPRTSQAMPVAVLILGLALVVIGQFFLDSPASTSEVWHWVQHGVLFAGGLAIGVAATLLYLAGRQLA
jgi:protein-S-isoprenylcysteine O-methyltransferase Ste14